MNNWSIEQKETIKQLINNGLSYSAIAETMNTTRSAIGGLIKRMGVVKNPTGSRLVITPEILMMRAEQRHRSKQDSRNRLRMNGERLPPRQYKPRSVALPEPTKNLPFAEMDFRTLCAYPVHEPDAPVAYCGHLKGLRLNGEPSSYCRGHHAMTHHS